MSVETPCGRHDEIERLKQEVERMQEILDRVTKERDYLKLRCGEAIKECEGLREINDRNAASAAREARHRFH